MPDIAMIVWHLTPVDSQRAGGLENCALSEAEALSAMGLTVSVAARRFTGARRGYRVQQVGFPSVLGRRGALGYYLGCALRNPWAAVYHAHNSPFVAALRPARTLVHLHNEVHFPGYGAAQARYGRAVYACCSKYLRTWLLNSYPSLPQDRVHVLYNAVDTKRFHPAPAGGHRGQRARVLFAGQWNEKKGLFLLMEAAEHLQENGCELELWLAGSARLWRSAQDQSAAQATEDRVNAWVSRYKHVRIVGAVGRDSMPDLYRSVDLVVVPSLWNEPLGLVPLEAMASGLPVVAFPVGGIPETVVDGQTGVLVWDRTPEALSDAIASLLADRRRLHRMGAAARAHVETHFAWSVHLQQLCDLYRLANPHHDAFRRLGVNPGVARDKPDA